jgi:hypothetical protein
LKPEWIAADCAREVHDAVRGWRSAGLVDDALVGAAADLYPLRGPEMNWVWRVLIFVLVSFAAGAVIVATFMILGIRDGGTAGAMLVLCGALMAWLTDALMNRFSYSDTGSEAATCVGAVLCTAAGLLLLFSRLHVSTSRFTQVVCMVLGCLLALASFRWGYWACAAGSAAAWCYLAMTYDQPALLRMLVGLCAAAGAAYLAHGPGSDGRPPARRRSFEAVLAVSLLALYASVNLYALDYGLLSELPAGGLRHMRTQAPETRALAGAGTVLIPCALLGWGFVARRRLLLDLGVITATLSLVTLRFYVHVAPLWVVAGASGAILVLTSLALTRFLKAGRDGERFGFTSTPLYDERRREQLLPIAGAIVLTPSARTITQTAPEVKGGGGAFGGGGASGDF